MVDIKGAMKNKKWLVAGGVVAVVGVVYEYRKASKNATASAAVPVTTDDTSDVQDPNAIDPATGIPYGEEESQDGYSAAYDDGGIVGSPYSGLSNLTWDPTTGQYVANPATGSTTPAASSLYGTATTNSQWAQEATTYLVNLGDDPLTVAAALGKYLTGNGVGVTQNELSIIQSAIGAIGVPPTPVPAPVLASNTGQTNPGAGVTQTNANAASYQKSVAKIQSLLSQYTAQNQGGKMNGQIEGAEQVLAALRATNTVKQNEDAARVPLRNFETRNSKGTYNNQLKGAQAAFDTIV